MQNAYRTLTEADFLSVQYIAPRNVLSNKLFCPVNYSVSAINRAR
jgi:hypothetical protein